MDRLHDKAHLLMLGAGLLNVALLPLWRLPIARATAQGLGYPLFAAGVILNLFSLLALKGGIGGKVEPVTHYPTFRAVTLPQVRESC